MMGWGEMGYPDFIRNVFRPSTVKWTSVVAKMVKKLSAKPSLIPGSGRPPGERNGSVQSLSCVWLFVTPWTEASEASLSITSSRSLLKFMSIELVMPSNHLILCHPLLLPSIFPSIRVFLNESVLCIRWPKYYWSFNFSISPSSEYSGLISFRMDWSPCSPRDSRVFPNTTVQKHQFFMLSFLYGPTLTSIHACLKNHSFD